MITRAGHFGAWPVLSSFSAGLFQASQRALASFASCIASVAGRSGSFVFAGLLAGLTGSLARTAAALAVGPLIPWC